MPTFNSVMLCDVRRAKNVRRLITKRANLGAGEKAKAEKFLPCKTALENRTQVKFHSEDILEDVASRMSASRAADRWNDALAVANTSSSASLYKPKSWVSGDPVKARSLVQWHVSMQALQDRSDDLTPVLKEKIFHDNLCRRIENSCRKEKFTQREKVYELSVSEKRIAPKHNKTGWYRDHSYT